MKFDELKKLLGVETAAEVREAADLADQAANAAAAAAQE